MSDIEAALRQALAESSAKQPVQISALRRLGESGAVEAALLAMYRGGEVNCCLVTKKTGETSLWWLAANSQPVRWKLF